MTETSLEVRLRSLKRLVKYTHFHKQYFYKQRKAEIGKKPGKC